MLDSKLSIYANVLPTVLVFYILKLKTSNVIKGKGF